MVKELEKEPKIKDIDSKVEEDKTNVVEKKIQLVEKETKNSEKCNNDDTGDRDNASDNKMDDSIKDKEGARETETPNDEGIIDLDEEMKLLDDDNEMITDNDLTKTLTVSSEEIMDVESEDIITFIDKDLQVKVSATRKRSVLDMDDQHDQIDHNKKIKLVEKADDKNECKEKDKSASPQTEPVKENIAVETEVSSVACSDESNDLLVEEPKTCRENKRTRFNNNESDIDDQSNDGSTTSGSKTTIDDLLETLSTDEAPKRTVPVLEKFKLPFESLSRGDLEQLVTQKVVESLVYQSECSDYRQKMLRQTEVIRSLRDRHDALRKMYDDLMMVNSRVIRDLQTRSESMVLPVKITRAVGLQVYRPIRIPVGSPLISKRPTNEVLKCEKEEKEVKSISTSTSPLAAAPSTSASLTLNNSQSITRTTPRSILKFTPMRPTLSESQEKQVQQQTQLQKQEVLRQQKIQVKRNLKMKQLEQKQMDGNAPQQYQQQQQNQQQQQLASQTRVLRPGVQQQIHSNVVPVNPTTIST